MLVALLMDMDKQLILVVDDDMDIRDCLQEALESEGYSIVTAKDGKEALEVLENPVRPGLILLDMMMPTMNACEFVEQQNQSPRLKQIPTVIMSASNVENKALDLSVSGHIKKPFDFENLLETVKHHCA